MSDTRPPDWIEIGVALALLVPPIVVVQQSRTSLAEQDVASGDAMTNAALYPQIVAALLGVLALWHLGSVLLATLRGLPAGKSRDDAANAPAWMPVASVVGLAGYLLALPVLGYHITTPAFIFAILMMFGVRLVQAAAFALALSLATAFVFEVLLNVVLPVGIFGIALPV
ncbi:tripartite tricarboxylate transporter TctB family protein [Aliiruegeria haliotis]|uniref:Tripartite tricarboxylate transporter TctB family protein n=1 Tax=Aliiruegeria haliotis TaxID=1280846 RepID=A0A2T0RFM0_9RHOB|nr:tripartite tricarboxylate transporter TctB family protein [Aliiruegeria haliotis]PRY19939.1 tripartite tricarboxylate transporter TctB family protein [Aliiruegeria haliotis]